MARAISLFVALAILWLLLSGHYNALLLTLGVVSCVFVVFISRRLAVVDPESVPLHMSWRLPGYWVWLVVEIIKANMDVTRRILDPKLPIDPRLFEVDATQTTDLGRVIYANSITLTPGTISTDVRGSRIQVHALTAEGEREVRSGTMDRKVSALERASA